ncbi:15150_t:CDS:2, partial [Gigaspora rosea]
SQHAFPNSGPTFGNKPSVTNLTRGGSISQVKGSYPLTAYKIW